MLLPDQVRLRREGARLDSLPAGTVGQDRANGVGWTCSARRSLADINAAMAGSVGAYAQNLMKMFPPNAGESAHPLDVIKDALLQCRSIAECQSLLAARQRHVQAPQSDVLTLYGDLLQQVG